MTTSMSLLRRPQSHLPKDAGFTLVEIAIVLVIVGLLLGGLLMPLATQVDNERRKQVDHALTNINDALVGFAVLTANLRLPCPDTDNDGLEDVTITVTDGVPAAGQSRRVIMCPATVGWLPYATIGSESQDSWGNLFRYSVTAAFAQRTTDFNGLGGTGAIIADTRFGLASTGGFIVNTRNPTTKAFQAAATGVPVVVLSQGANGRGARSHFAVDQQPAAVGTDEATNSAGGLTYITRSKTPEQSVCSDIGGATPFCEYDDIVSWIPTSLLVSRMVAAGQLPF